MSEALEGIAVVGMAARYPGARNLEEYWRILRDGTETITRFTAEELEAAGIDPALLADENYVRANGMLADADLFDAEFFGFSPREAQILDPQQRIFLECSHEALERTGYEWHLPWAHIDLEPADVVQVALDDGTLLNVRLLETELGANLELAWKTVLEEQSSYAAVPVTQGGIGYRRVSEIYGSEARLFVMDIPLLEDGILEGDENVVENREVGHGSSMVKCR